MLFSKFFITCGQGSRAERAAGSAILSVAKPQAGKHTFVLTWLINVLANIRKNCFGFTLVTEVMFSQPTAYIFLSQILIVNNVKHVKIESLKWMLCLYWETYCFFLWKSKLIEPVFNFSVSQFNPGKIFPLIETNISSDSFFLGTPLKREKKQMHLVTYPSLGTSGFQGICDRLLYLRKKFGSNKWIRNRCGAREKKVGREQKKNNSYTEINGV